MASSNVTAVLVLQSMADARREILLQAASSFAFFGLYLGLFLATVWTFRLKHSDSVVQRRLQMVVYLTALLLLLKQIVISVGISDVCAWTQVRYVSSDGGYEDVTLCGATPLSRSVPSVVLIAMVELYIPPILIFLSDGILAWRVYVVWNRPPWLRYFLFSILLTNCVLGLFIAVSATVALEDSRDWIFATPHIFKVLYAFWSWMAFAVNAALSLSILVFMRAHLFDLRGPHMSRSATAIEALIESAVLSWVGTLGSAITSLHGPYEHPFDTQDQKHSVSRHNAQLFSEIILVILSHLLAISQVLIILRVNMTKLNLREELGRTASGISISEHELEVMPPSKQVDHA